MLLLLIALTLAPVGTAAGQTAPVQVVVTQRALVPLCLDGAPVAPGRRAWRLAPAEHTLSFTMENAPRSGAADVSPDPGIAALHFTLDAGHTYEIEVRARAMTYAEREWTKGSWIPVVRDRTVDAIVSGDPVWRRTACAP
jgi:hypothetical protein